MSHQFQLRTTRLSRLFATALFALAVVAMNGATFGQGVSTPLNTVHNVDPGPVVYIGNAANPVAVDWDGAGLPWHKNIGDPNNNVMGLGNMDIIETLVNIGTETWTDWHEIFLPPPVGLTPPVWTSVVGLSVNGNPITFSATGLGTGTLDLFNFSQFVQPGDIFRIHKQALVDGSSFAGAFLRLQEYPTVPEPACLALLAMGGASIAGTRRRR